MKKQPAHTLGLANWRDSCSPFVLHILDRFYTANHQVYIVGGAVRDMLLGIPPKDIDIVTSATPKEVLALFKRTARKIGKRFTIVHLYDRHGGYIEVSTLRRTPVHADDANNYGTSVIEDASRRDFTVNSLYLDIKNELVLDAHNAVADINDRYLRFIAPIDKSIIEDPVRMLRAIHFAAKLGWQLPRTIQDQCVVKRHLLAHSSPGRLLDVVQKLLLTGSGDTALQLLHACQLDSLLFIGCAEYTQADWQMVQRVLQHTDARIKQQHTASVPFLFATLLWPSYQQAYFSHTRNKTPSDYKQHQQAHSVATRMVLAKQTARIHILMHMQQRIADTWHAQWIVQQQPDAYNPHHQTAIRTSAFRLALALYDARMPCTQHKIDKQNVETNATNHITNHSAAWNALYTMHAQNAATRLRKRKPSPRRVRHSSAKNKASHRNQSH